MEKQQVKYEISRFHYRDFNISPRNCLSHNLVLPYVRNCVIACNNNPIDDNSYSGSLCLFK